MTKPGPWKYQWRAHGRPIPGATNALLRIASLSADDLACYQVGIRTANDPANTVYSQNACVLDPSLGFIKGELKEELYLDVPGKDVGSLQRSSKFPFHPDRTEAITTFEVRPDTGDFFGRRLSGWIIPTETAEYVFYLCSDDSSQLSLGTEEMPEAAKVIATLSDWRDYREWQTIPGEAISKPIRLQAGQRYFVEVLHKEGDGKDHVSVAWRKAGKPAPKNGDAPISGEFLARPAL